ncbi:hypothetical protein HY78_08700 [Rhizorhabdus wittichii DC-6]|nr:hypothetical protein HY78_08700 [Rhizorhabdus wittichii DC-6]
MSSIADGFNAAWRNYVIDGVPSSGPYEPEKALIRAIGPMIDQALGNIGLGAMIGVIKDTKSNLDADLAHDANTVALVYGDGTAANNDLYVKVGASGSGSWTNTGALHDIMESLGQPYVDAAQAAAEQAAEVGDTLLDTVQTIGFTGTLPTASNGSGGTYTFVKPIAQDGRGIRYRYRANLAGTIRVQIASKSGDTITILQERTITVSGAGEGAAEFLDVEYEAGQFVGIRCTPTGVIAAIAGTDEEGGWWYTNAQISIGNNYTDTTPTTNIRVVHGFELLAQVVTGPDFTAMQEAVAALTGDGTVAAYHIHWVLGESHAAGVPTTLSPIVIPADAGYRYRRSTESLAQLQDPTGNSTTSAGPPGRGSMFVSFGQQLLRETTGTIGAIIANSGEGGTTVVTHWASGGGAWLQAVTDWGKVLTAIQADELIISGCSISIILGSNDAINDVSKATFKAAMLDLISRARATVGAGDDVPVVLMQTGSFADNSHATAVADVQAAQAEIVAEEPNVFMGYSARYAVARGQMIDNVHMNQAFNDVCGASLAVPAAAHGAGLRPAALA